MLVSSRPAWLRFGAAAVDGETVCRVVWRTELIGGDWLTGAQCSVSKDVRPTEADNLGLPDQSNKSQWYWGV